MIVNQLTLKQGDYLEDLGRPCVITGSLKVVEIGRRGESEGDVMGEDGRERGNVVGFEDGGRGGL